METDEEQQPCGLTTREVHERIAAGQVNANADVHTRTVSRILRDNLCTLFNLVNLVLAAAVFWTGEYRNLLFMVIILANIAIGIFQEVRSKLLVDRLSVLTSTRVHVMRNGGLEDLEVAQIVLDDVISLGRGDQVPADCCVVSGRCMANESLITGEADPIPKRVGDELYSGSFIVAGTCRARVTAVGADNYANRLNNGAKAYKRIGSEIMESLRSIVRYVSIALVPIGALLFAKEALLSPHGDVTSAILHTSAALIGMIPQGLILLTSAVLAVSVFRLAQNRVLAQQIYCVETLARVDVVCLDKTGTITSGRMDVDEVIPLAPATYDDALHALKALVAVEDKLDNGTSRAVREYVQDLLEPADMRVEVTGDVRAIPFSSERKYSGVCYGSNEGNYALGAVEFVLKEHERLSEVADMAERLGGVRRVLVLARVGDFDEHDAITGIVEPLGLVFVKDRIRASAAETLDFFRDQGVRVNVISGDSVSTVSKIARSAGVEGADKCIDMSRVSTQGELEWAARECRVFGRVSPTQKRQLVEALKAQGHTVAMAGDGVNDVLALHAADCSIAMGSGSDAARSIAQIVLLDDDFAAMPKVVAEGRRAINNLQRSAVLYLTKTLFSAVLAVLFIPLVTFDYPFSPVQVSVISFFVIGLPSLVLALEPNRARVRGHFLRNVATRSVPGAVAIVVAIVSMIVAGQIGGVSQAEFQTMCVISTAAIGMNVVIRQAQPLNVTRAILVAACIAGLLVSMFAFDGFLGLAGLPAEMLVADVCLTNAILAVFNLAYTAVVRRQKEYLDALEARRSALAL